MIAAGKTFLSLSLTSLLDYTEWERQKWHDWMLAHGDHVLKVSAGEHGDGRFQTIGDCVRHIFSAEKRYVERLEARPLTDTSTIPSDNIETLFQFGRESRSGFRSLLETFPADQWDGPREFKILTSSIKVTPRKIAVHMVLHETRHWAQIATLFRLNGLKGDYHDFLFAPVFGGEVKLAKGN
jgi:uncharacterized damage-inducible protein DinB